MKVMKLIKYIGITLLIVLPMFSQTKPNVNKANAIEDSTGSIFFVKAKVNETPVYMSLENYIDGRAGQVMEGLFEFAIRGEIPNTGMNLGSLEGLSITLRDEQNIQQSVYSNVENFKYGLKGVTISYHNAALSPIAYITDPNKPNSYLHIVELTNETIKGFFNGTVIDFSTGKTIDITEGEFFVKRLN